MPNFAEMKEIKFDYKAEGILLLTAFDEVSRLDTASLDGYMILGCNNGRMDVDVNGFKHHLEAFEALILPPHTRLTNYMVSPDVRCDLALISAEMVRLLLQNHIEEWNRSIYVNKTNHIVTTEETRRQFDAYVGILCYKIGQQSRRYNKEVIQSIIRSILFDYLEIMMEAVPNVEAVTTEGQHKILFKRFLELLTTRHVKYQLVDTYAQELCVSPNYLTKICREVTGKTALQWIREYTEADIRYYLLNSDMSVKEICDALGFSNLSFFGKYCKRAFGQSPNEFRRNSKKTN
ncbi:AraC family transcriptional regulator [Bacteroides heparinolyticus]|uniref:AraC family transcriptional regulator n=1 Tax=Prevotella heparinolytica TaxID=28113 RepID=A0A449I2B1_9BACE|nr:helix-turn-helix domain-containing protein [Bacteroides heparinolyticus]VFB13582.1 AraC family transcriptional regulator [Bacteroides heparinolyticus]